ncbi:MAG: sugar phosphate isomerase/epimerase [Chloroflexi bacterium]|nr:MAG: sugar phosphate isomerase/epimerase [Chloroflexota bacterium]
MSTWKYSVILGFLGKLNDRFATYGEQREIAGKFELASKIEGIQGLELVYPFDFADVAVTKTLLKQHNLACSTVNVNIKSEAKFHLGALTSKDAGIRKEAVSYLQQAMDLSADLGTNMITCCPLSDGYDYAFEIDYPKAWKWFIDGVGTAASYRADVRVSMEYKQSEPRHKVIIPNSGTTLAACLQVGLPNVGVTMDMGHALYTGEGTAQAAGLLAQAGKLFLVHVNDNYRNWDWDMIPGSVNTWDLVECMYYLGEIGYRGWLTSDVAPFRLDSVKTCSATYRSVVWAEKVVEKVGREKIREIIAQGDPVDALDALQAAVLG